MATRIGNKSNSIDSWYTITNRYYRPTRMQFLNAPADCPLFTVLKCFKYWLINKSYYISNTFLQAILSAMQIFFIIIYRAPHSYHWYLNFLYNISWYDKCRRNYYYLVSLYTFKHTCTAIIKRICHMKFHKIIFIDMLKLYNVTMHLRAIQHTSLSDENSIMF